ncbi:hypothetical protein FS749_010290, partial [Ceratobasidium sp. UAMH 11750]
MGERVRVGHGRSNSEGSKGRVCAEEEQAGVSKGGRRQVRVLAWAWRGARARE